MNNIFKEIKELEKKYCHIELEGDTLLKYNKFKKNPLIAYFLVIFSPILLVDRLYLGDRFSLFYAVLFGYALRLTSKNILLMFSLVNGYGTTLDIIDVLNVVLYLIVIMVLVGEVIFIPFVCKRNNLLLKQQLIENPSVDYIIPKYLWILLGLSLSSMYIITLYA